MAKRQPPLTQAGFKPKLAKLQNANDVHFSTEGSQELAKHVAQSIQKVMEAK